MSRAQPFLLLTPAVAAAQSFPVPYPKALIFPNYDNVLIGKDEALEAGAYIARVGDASANFYNPAGLVVSEKTSLNASSTGYVWSRLHSQALDTSISSTKLDELPGYFGLVIAPPFGDVRNLRLGLSITRGVAWTPGAIDQSTNAPDFVSINRLTYSTDASFKTINYKIAAAWAPVADRSLRLGFALAFSETTYSNNSTFSGLVSVALAASVSATDSVPQNDHAVAEPALINQFQLQPHTIREVPFSGADDRRADEHLKLVNKTSP